MERPNILFILADDLGWCDLGAGGSRLHRLVGHKRSVSSLAWSTEAHFLYSGGEDCLIRQWRRDTGECVRVLEGHTDYVRCLHVPAQATGRLWSGGADLTGGSRRP